MRKRAFITGATGDIGWALSLAFAQKGYDLGLHYYSNEQKSKELLEALSPFGGEYKVYQADLSKVGEAKKLIERYEKDFDSLNCLINNSGMTKDNYIIKMEDDDFKQVIDTNLYSAWSMSKAVTRKLMKQRYGSIINISSIVGLEGNLSQTNYAASKAGLIGLSKSLALELGSRNIRVNAIAPGFIKTKMTDVLPEEYCQNIEKNIPLGRFGNPEEVAELAVFLASDQASYITGQTISIDGGLHR